MTIERPYDMVPKIVMIESLKICNIYDKLHWKSHEKLESGIYSERRNFSKSENPERHLPERLPLATTICNVIMPLLHS